MTTPETDEIAKISKEIALYELIGKQYGLSAYHDAILQKLRLKRMRLEIERIERRMKGSRRKNESGQNIIVE